MSITESKNTPSLPSQRVAAELMLINSLVSERGDYQKLTNAAIKLGIIVRNYPSSESVEEKVDTIISIVSNSNPDSHLLEFFIHSLVIDRETSSSDGQRKNLSQKLVGFLNPDQPNQTPEDDSLVDIMTGLGGLIDLYVSIESALSAQERAILFEKVERLIEIRDEKIAQRASEKK